jgi:hypothetical protein
LALDYSWNGAEPELEAARRGGLVPENLPSTPFMATYDDSPLIPKAVPSPIPDLPGVHSPIPDDTAFNFKPFEPISAPTFSPVPPLPGDSLVPPADPAAEQKALKAAIGVGPDVTTEKVKRSDALLAAQKNLSLLGGERANTQDDLTAHKVAVAGEVSEDAKQRLVDRAQMEKEAREQRARLEADQQKAKDAARELRERHAKDYERSFFEERGTAKSWISILSVGLGALGQGLSAMGGVRQDNLAWEVMQKMMNDHSAREKGRLLRQKEEIERRGEDVSRIDQQLKDFDTITMPQMRASLLEKAAERRETLLAKHGASKEQIEGDMLRQKLQEETLKDTIHLETQLAERVRVSNENQNQLKRQLALQSAKGPNNGRPLTEGQNKGVSTVGTALDKFKDALDTTTPLSKKDMAILRKIEAEARTVRESDPAKAWAAFSQLSGRYYEQLTPNGFRRLRAFEDGFRDLERNTSGAMIGPVETIGMVARAQEEGGVKTAIQRARRFANFAGPKQQEVLKEVDDFEKNLGGREGPAPADPRQQAAVRAEAAQMLRGARDPGQRARLEWIIGNPGDPRASAALSKAKSLQSN